MIRSYTGMRKGSKESGGGGGILGQNRRAQTFAGDAPLSPDGEELCDFAFDLHVVGNANGGKSDVIASFIGTNGADRIRKPSQLDNLDDDTNTSVVHVPHRGCNTRLKIHEALSSPKDPKMLNYYTFTASGVFIVYSSDDVTTRMEAEEVWWPLYKGVCESGKPVFLIEIIPGLLTGMTMPSATTFSSKKFQTKGKSKHKPEFRTAPAGKSALIREIFLDAIDRMIKATDPKAFDRLEMGAPLKPQRSHTLATSRSMTPLTGPPSVPPPSGPPPSIPPPTIPPPSTTPLPPLPINSPPSTAQRAPSPRGRPQAPNRANSASTLGSPNRTNSMNSFNHTNSMNSFDSPTEVNESDSDSDWEKDIVKGLRDVCNRKVEQGDYAGAEKSLERYLKRVKDPKDQETYKVLLAETQARQGKLNNAQRLLLGMIQNDLTKAVKVPDAGHLLADCYLANNELDKAEEVIRYVMKARRKVLGKKDKATIESVGLLIEVLQRRGDEEEAEVLQTFLPRGFSRTTRAMGKTIETMALEAHPRQRKLSTYKESEAASPSHTETCVPGPLPPLITRTETEPAIQDSADSGFWKGRFYSLGGAISRPQSPLGTSVKPQSHLPAFYPDLHTATARGDAALVNELLVKRKIYVNSRSYPSGQTALHVLCECEDAALSLTTFEALRRSEQILDVNAADSAGDTPLHLAFRWKRASLARRLIANWAHLGAANALGNTPAHEAVYAGEEMMEMLLTLPPSVRDVHPAYLSLANKVGKTPLYVAIEQNKSVGVIGLLIKSGAGVNAIGADSVAWTPLHIAATMKRLDCLKLLLDGGAKTDVLGKGSSKFHTPLSLAAKKGAEDVAKMLLDHGASPRAVSIESKSEGSIKSAEPLFEALSAGNETLVKLLLSYQQGWEWKAEELKTYFNGSPEAAARLWTIVEDLGLKRPKSAHGDDIDQPN